MIVCNVIHGSPIDNVVTCCAPIAIGDSIPVGAVSVEATDNIPIYHKMAITHIPAGTPVFKYGQPIGIASTEILPGQHVHVQNLESDRGRGDRKKGDTK